ncbi:MAG TPA: hypothetical protein VL242_27890 [Sorangium sp.]|nr:hypothetical protein [Sorangium sp.]
MFTLLAGVLAALIRRRALTFRFDDMGRWVAQAPEVLTLSRLRSVSGQGDRHESDDFPGVGAAYLIRDDPHDVVGDELTAFVREALIPHTYRVHASFTTTTAAPGPYARRAADDPHYPQLLRWLRQWRVETIDGDRREVHAVPGKSLRTPKFVSLAVDIHPRVHAKMRELACASDVPTYLDRGAKEILAHVRGTAHLVGRFQPALQPVWPAERSRAFLWAGTRVQRTVFLALREAGLEVHDEHVGLEVKAPVDQTREVLRGPQDPRLLAARADRELAARQCGADKFDWALQDALWAAAYAEDRLAISRGAFEVG